MTLKHKLDIIILYYLVHISPSARHALCLKVTMITKEVYKQKKL